MNRETIAELANGLTVHGYLTTDHAASSYGQPVFVDDDGTPYNTADILNLHVLDEEPAEQEDTVAQAIDIVRSRGYTTPSAYEYHIDNIRAKAPQLIDQLSPVSLADVIVLMQHAYQHGKADAGAEKIDIDAVWVNGIGGLERQTDGLWKLTAADDRPSLAAAALGQKGGQSTSEAKREAARANGRKGGRPRKSE